jgi:DNA sulfur modification protein DndD
VYLKTIALRDWKAYAGENRLELPAPTSRKNVVLIGAPNGFGKTSLLEALLFGLYGKDALPLVARASKTTDREADKGYHSFLKRALHARALEEGRTSMTVELEFEDLDSEAGSLTVTRTWHFRNDGAFREEEIRVFTGAERKPLRRPRLEDDEEDFFRGFVARETLPAHLAQFFLFDGEQVQRLAQTDMGSQVRVGIEGMLGATVLRNLQTDLLSYARDRRTRLRDVANDDTLERVREELEQLQAKQEELATELASLTSELGPLTQKRDGLRERLQSLQGGNVDNAKELQRKKDLVEAELARLKENLSQLLTNDFALAVSGRVLRKQVLERLGRERELASWEGGIQNSTRQLKRFAEEFGEAPPAFDPPLTKSQRDALDGKIEAAWQAMWHPPPEACADFYRHSYLGESDRAFVEDRLSKIDCLGQNGIADLLYGVSQSESDKRRYENQLASFQAIGSQLSVLLEELQSAMTDVSEKSARRQQVERELVGLDAQIQTKKTEYQRLSSKYQTAQPELARINIAEKIAEKLPAFIEDATGKWVTKIAEHMTESYREIAHKGQVVKVEIDRDCNVRLLTRGGHDYRTLDASAGEDQVFSFALISAVARSADIRFPIIIDTPLARLDREHRKNILRHFAERAGDQIVLLSQNTEVVGEYLDEIRGRVAKTFSIEHKQIGDGFGQNRIAPDKYFEPI